MIAPAAAAASRRLVLLGPAWTRAFRCIWMLEELGLAYQVDDKAMPVSRAVRKHVSTGKVPVLLEFDHDSSSSSSSSSSSEPSFVLSESAAINTYLCDEYGGIEGQLIPPVTDNRARAKYNETVSCIVSELDSQGLWLHRKHEAMAQHFGKIPDAVAAARQQFERINAHLGAQLNPYLVGEHFTAADILYVHCLDWSKGIGWHEHWPSHLEAYRQLCHQRPAYQRAKRQRDAEKTGQKKNGSDDGGQKASSISSL